uniref:Uncharacterized protein n=1 Tax=Trichogramma kaykai TaxID=54128 RepID=A0ABD2W0B4_9HYME
MKHDTPMMKSEARTTLTRRQQKKEEYQKLTETHSVAPEARTTLTRCSRQSKLGTCHRRQKREPQSQDGTRQRVLKEDIQLRRRCQQCVTTQTALKKRGYDNRRWHRAGTEVHQVDKDESLNP